MQMSSLNIEKTIKVIIYSYKGKKLQSVIENLQKNSSGYNKIFYDIWDQYPLLRDTTIGKMQNVNYQHIFWDHVYGPSKYINISIESCKEEYVLILSDNIFLLENWDEVFLNTINGTNNILSGQGKTIIMQDDIFFIKTLNDHSSTATISNWIDKDFIFCKKSQISLIKYPKYLKYLGINETMSILAFCNNINIVSLPSDSFVKISDNTIGKLYTPFSIIHKYNEMLQLIKTGKNNYINLDGLPRTLQDFTSFHSLSVDSLKYLPFIQDDVDYDPHEMKFDKLDSRKFMTRVHYIS
jgi:hypothetical protein